MHLLLQLLENTDLPQHCPQQAAEQAAQHPASGRLLHLPKHPAHSERSRARAAEESSLEPEPAIVPDG